MQRPETTIGRPAAGKLPIVSAALTLTGSSTDGTQRLRDDTLWENSFDPLPLPEATSDNPHGEGPSSRKRRREVPVNPEVADTTSIWLSTTFPGLEPSRLQLPDRIWIPQIPNPFLLGELLQHPRTRRPCVPALIPQDSCVNGLIKVRFNFTKRPNPDHHESAKLQRFPWSKSKATVVVGVNRTPVDLLRYLPPDFGRGLKLKPKDEKLFNFFRIAICAGVTLIPTENCYLQEIMPMAARSDCVKHSILAVAATYLLDYMSEEHLRLRANFHWKRAVHLLTKELNSPETCQPGKEDAIIAALTLFARNETVNWEMEQPREEDPSWYRASHLAEQILAKSDPLYRYHFPSNVQCNRARIRLGNNVALHNVMSAIVWPFKGDEERCAFTWLLEGKENELRKIMGSTGCSARLMHTFAQITHLSAKLLKDPERLTAQKLGSAIEQRLHNFWQWSDLSKGYATSQELLDSCELDENGKVSSCIKVTELVAESYVAAAQIYLYCRLLRQPRKHPKVQAVLRRLLCCIDRMPTSGPLFTGQSTQVRVFVAAVVAWEPAHRTLIRNWFEDLVDGTRGNVPPVWRAVQFMWGWLDAKFDDVEIEELHQPSETSFDPTSEPWWESLVGEIFAREGKLNLS